MLVIAVAIVMGHVRRVVAVMRSISVMEAVMFRISIEVVVGVPVMEIRMMIAVVMMMVVIVAPAGQRIFPVDRIGREIAGTGIGRTLIGVIILMHRIGQPLITPTTTAAAIAARIDRRWDIAMHARAVAACQRGRSAYG